MGIKDDKKELIKENLKIKNQLQIVNSEYENIKRIYNNLLEEYLDLQFEENFDKVLIIQDEVSILKANNLKLSEELRLLKEELSSLTLKEKEENYGQAVAINEENEKLKQELNEKELELIKLNLEIENFKEQQISVGKLVDEMSKTKEELMEENIELKNQLEETKEELVKNKIECEKNSHLFQENLSKNEKISELNKFINELQSEFEKIENEKNESFQEGKKLNCQINEMIENNKKHEEKYIILEEEFEKTLEDIEFAQNYVSTLEKKVKEFEKNKEETDDYVNAMQLELEKALDELRNINDMEKKLNSKIYDFEKSNILKDLEIEKLNNQLKETQNILNLKEENYNLTLNSLDELNKKIIENENKKEEEFSQLKNNMESEIIYKNSELEQTMFLYEDSLNKLNDLEKEFLNLKELMENHKKLEQHYTRAVHKNYDFRLMTSKMIGKFIEEQNKLKGKIKKLELKEEIYKNENVLIFKENRRKNEIIEEQKEKNDETAKIPLKNNESEHSFKHVLHKEHRVNIRNIFGDTDVAEETTDVLGSMICSLERRKEFHPYATEDTVKQEKIGEIILTEENILVSEDEHVNFDKVCLGKGTDSPEEAPADSIKEIYAFENKSTMKKIEQINLGNRFEELLKEKNLEENNVEAINDSDKTEKRVFVKNKELFSKEKTEEFADFLKFMLPRTIEDDIPLLEKDMFYFMVSFAFYNYNGEDFWDLLLDKLDISLNERGKYKVYLRKELNTIIKMHNFYQLKDGKGDRVGASIIMHSILPVKQMKEYLNSIKNIYMFDLEGIVDKNVFPELLLNKLQEEKIYGIVKSLNYLKKSDNLEKLLEYSYEILKVLDWKSRGIENKRITINNAVVEKIVELSEKKSIIKKNRFSFDSFYGFGKK